MFDRITAALFSSSLLLLTGCAGLQPTSPLQQPGARLHGQVFGGQQPITGAHIYLFAAATTGYGAASESLLTTGDGTDTLGTYETTDANGNFDITGEYTCTLGDQVYILSTGGNPGLGSGETNPSAYLAAALGTCPAAGNLAGTVPRIVMNEATTVAFAWALSAFAVDSTHIGSAATTASQAGLANAFQTASQLVNVGNGIPYLQTGAVAGYAQSSGLSANGTAPYSKVASMANILSACVSSNGKGVACTSLFNKARDSNNKVAGDTVGAAINIAHTPSDNVATLYALEPAGGPFQPTLTSEPNDWTLSIAYTAPNSSTPTRAAIDASGNVWIPNQGNNSITQLSPNGVVLSGTTGFTGNSLSGPQALAINPHNGHIYVGNNAGGKVSDFTSTGTASTSYAVTGTHYTVSFANTGVAYIGTANGVSQISATGAVSTSMSNVGPVYGLLTSTTGAPWASDEDSNDIDTLEGSTTPTLYTGDSLSGPAGMAEDASGNIWIANTTGNSLSVISQSGTADTATAGHNGGGVTSPWNVAVDGLGSVYVANGNGTISQFTSAGDALSPLTGYTTPSTAAIYSVSVDASGNVWAPASDGKIYKFVGLAAPVNTPINNTTPGVRP